MHLHFHAHQSHFHQNTFAFKLALKQRHKGIWKWPMSGYFILSCKDIYVNHYVHEHTFPGGIFTETNLKNHLS